MTKRFCLALTLIAATCSAAGAEPSPKGELIEVRKIWDQAPHNAFTDLIRFGDRWLCVFREGRAHVSRDGALRVIASPDAKEWTSAALLASKSADLRDAKITTTPDGRLMLSGAAAWHQPKPATHQSLAWFSSDGESWSEPIEIGDPDFWLWRTTWRDGTAYSVGYGTSKQSRFARLYSSRDGRKFDPLVDKLFELDYPNESSLLFDDAGQCLCLLRRDAGSATAQLGSSRPPYTLWAWKDLGRRLGGPHLIRLPSGKIVAAGRLYDKKVRTALCWLDPASGTLTEFVTLPSGGDTSYPGLVWRDGLLWVSYYSSHEGKTGIYLAKVKIDD